MPKRCPHCSSVIDMADVAPGSAICPGCGREVRSTHSMQRLDETRVGGEKSAQITITYQKNAEDFAKNAGVLPKALGRYELLEELGSGAFGRVFRGHDTELRRTVAIKILKKEQFASQADLDSFFEEARLMASVHHPGIVMVHDVGTDQGLDYIVTQHVAGGTLHDRLSRGALTHTESAELISQCARAVHAAHRVQLYHRDLKPRNILLDEQGRAVVADFGLAIRRRDQNDRVGEISGSANFMAPEQVRGDVNLIDGRTDLWALGVILYLMLTNELPFQGSMHSLITDIQKRVPVPPRQLNESIPRELEQICLKCLEKTMGNRYSTAFDLAEDLDRWLTSRPGSAHEVFELPTVKTMAAPSAPADAPPTRRPPWRNILVSLVILAGLGWIAHGLYFSAPNSTTGDKPPDPFRVDEVAVVRRPFTLLEVAPKPTVWPDKEAITTARWFFDEKHQELLVDVPEVGLMGLGQTGSQNFRIRSAVSLNSTVGTAGIFWGHKEGVSKLGVKEWKCHAVVVEGILVPRLGQVKNKLCYREITFTEAPGFAVPGMSSHPYLSTDVIISNPGELVLTVHQDRLTNIQWGGQDFSSILEKQAGSLPIELNSQGVFGVLALGTSAVFSDARVTLFEKFSD